MSDAEIQGIHQAGTDGKCASPEPVCRPTVWDISADWGAALDLPTAEVPDSCGNPVWSLVGSGSLSADPENFSLLDNFTNSLLACDPAGPNFQGWFKNGYGASPFVLLNATGVSQSCIPSYPITVPAGAVDAHPAPGMMAGVAWKSPFNGRVLVETTFTDLDPNGGDGFSWVIEKNSTILDEAAVVNGGFRPFSREIEVSVGDYLYFMLGPGYAGEYTCDSTWLQIRVTPVDYLSAAAGGPYYCGPGDSVMLDGRGSSSRNPGGITSYTWRKGSTQIGTGPTLSFDCGDQTGDQTVILEVTDATGSDTDTALVKVLASPTAQILFVTPPPVLHGDSVTLQGSTRDDIVSWSWTSNIDGLLSNKQSFTTTSLSPGNHTITYTIKTKPTLNNPLGRSSSASAVVNVLPDTERIDLALEFGDIQFSNPSGGIESNPPAGDAVVIKATVHNLSTSIGSEAATVQFYDSYQNNGPVLIGQASTETIPPAGQSAASLPWTTPESQPGYHVIQAVVLPVASETYATNNSATHFLMLAGDPGTGTMTIVKRDPPTGYTLSPQQRFPVDGNFYYAYENNGTTTLITPLMGGEVTIRFKGREDVWQTLTDANGDCLQWVTAPVSEGLYTLETCASDGTLSNCFQEPVQVYIPTTDLAVTNVWLENRVQGQPEIIHATVTNTGGTTITADFSCTAKAWNDRGNQVYESIPPVPVTTDLPPGASREVTFAGWIPADVGWHTVQVEASAVQDETNIANNILAIRAYIYPDAVDLVPVEIRKDCDKVSVRIINKGGRDYTSGSVVDFYADGVHYGSAKNIPAVPGQEVSYPQVWVQADPYTGSATQFTAVVSPGGRQIPGIFPPPVDTDGEVMDVWVNDKPWANIVYLSPGSPNQIVSTLRAVVRNAGCQAISGTVKFLADATVIPGGGAAVSNLQPGETTTVSVNVEFTNPPYPAGTNYQLTGWFDVANDSRSGNDRRPESLTIAPSPADYFVSSGDITFRPDSGRRDPSEGELTRIEATIRNLGPAAAQSFRVVFSEKGALPIGEMQTIDLTGVGGLAVGAPYTVHPVDAHGNEVKWSSTVPGAHEILVSVSPVAGNQDDPDDSNNQATRAVWVGSEAIDDSFTTGEDQAAVLTVLANDFNPTGTLLIGSVTQPGHGTANISADQKTITYTPAADFFGQDSFTYSVTDDPAVSATANVSITVLPVNDPPTLDALSPLTINEDAGPQTVGLSGITAGGGESQTLTVTATSSNPGLIPNPAVTYTSPNATGSLVFTPVANANGTATITVTVNDGQAANNTAVRTFVVTVNAVNDQPTLAAPPPLTISEDAAQQTVVLGGISAGGGESQTLTVTATSSNPGLIPNPSVSYTSPNATGSLVFTPVANANGTSTITVTVNDGQAANNTVVRAFLVTVDAVNDPPTLDALSPLTINEDAGPQTVALSGITAGGGESQTLTVTATSSNPALIPNPAVTYTSPNATGSLAFAPVANANGTATITVTVNDGQAANNTAVRTFVVTVGAVNDMPSFTKGTDQTVSQNSGAQTVVGWATAISAGPANESSQALTFTTTNTSSTLFSVQPAVAANGTLTYTPAANASGTATVTVTLTDDATAGGPALTTPAQTFSITIAFPGVTVLNPWVNLYSASPNNTSASNLNVGNVTVGNGTNRLLLVSVVMEIGTAANPTISASYGGTALTQIQRTSNTQREIVWMGYVKDTQIGSGSKALTITYSGATGKVSALHVKWASFINVKQATPVGSSGAQSAAATSVMFGSTITYVQGGLTTVVAGNGGTPATATLSAIPPFTAGTITTSNAQSSQTFTTATHTSAGSYPGSTAVVWSGTTSLWSGLVVASLQPAGPNQPPSFTTNPISKPDAIVGVPYIGPTLAGSATDPEGDAITYSKVGGPAWLNVAADGALTGTPLTIANDSFLVRATATGGYAEATLNIRVVAAPAGVAQLSAWTNLSSTTPNSTSVTNLAVGSITVGGGSNRLLLVSVVMEIGTAANPTISATYGGAALTPIQITANTQSEIVWMGYAKEAQIGTGSKALAISFSGATGNATGLHVNWASYTGVNQTTPVAGSGAQNTNKTSAAFGSTINYVANGMTVVMAANGGTPATGALSATPSFTAGSAVTSSGHTSKSYTTARHTAAGSYAGTTAATWSGTTTRSSGLVVVSLQP